jgi:hypothetical protein
MSLIYVPITLTEAKLIMPTIIGEHRLLVTEVLVEFEKQLVQVEDFRKIAFHFREI